jgi:hypothetical protein
VKRRLRSPLIETSTAETPTIWRIERAMKCARSRSMSATWISIVRSEDPGGTFACQRAGTRLRLANSSSTRAIRPGDASA